MRADAEALLFSLKCYAAALLAYYVAIRIGLDRPFWAITTVYITAQPLAGAAIAKSIYRLLGTVLGAAVAVALVPNLVDEPIVLSLALAAWLGVCCYLSALDKTPRAYVLLLAGYTASIVGFPSVDVPQTIFDTAIVRVQEIALGIACTSLFHGFVLPRTVTDKLVGRVDGILAEVRDWSMASFDGRRDAELDKRRRRIATDLAELTTLSVQLPFDTARLVPRVRIVRALQDRLTAILPLVVAVDDRISELTAMNAMPDSIASLVERTRRSLHDMKDPEGAEHAARLVAHIRQLESLALWSPAWRHMLGINLLSRLAAFLEAVSEAHLLAEEIKARRAGSAAFALGQAAAGVPARSVYRDRPRAVRIAVGACVTVSLGCAFWISTGWPSGANAVLIMGVGCALFSGAPDPKGATVVFTIGAIAGIALAALYAYAILPRVTDPVMFAIVLAPGLLFIGSVLGRPAQMLPGLGMAVGFCNTVGLTASYEPDFAAFANGSLSLVAATGFAAYMLGVFQTIGSTEIVARMRRAGNRDVALRARGRARDADRWAGRMLDRVGLLSAKVGDTRGPDHVLDALTDLQTGYAAGELSSANDARTDDRDPAVAATLAGIGTYFKGRDPMRPDAPPVGLLIDLDRAARNALDSVDDRDRRNDLVNLTSLRRSLFPHARPFEAAMDT